MYIQTPKNKMKYCTRKPLQQIIALTLIFKMRHQTTKSIKRFLRSCIAKVARNAKNKCSGAHLEVSWSRVAGLGGLGKGDDMGAKENCYVQRRF